MKQPSIGFYGAIPGGIEIESIKMDECIRDGGESGVRVYVLGTHVATLGAVAWVDRNTSERLGIDAHIDLIFDSPVFRPEAVVRLVGS